MIAMKKRLKLSQLLLGLFESARVSRRIRLRNRLSEGCDSASRFFGAFFLSHVWCKYRNKMFFFSVMITASYYRWLIKRSSNKMMLELLCSAGMSDVGKYTEGLFIDEVLALSYNEKFSSLCTGKSFRNSPTDYDQKNYFIRFLEIKIQIQKKQDFNAFLNFFSETSMMFNFFQFKVSHLNFPRYSPF